MRSWRKRGRALRPPSVRGFPCFVKASALAGKDKGEAKRTDDQDGRAYQRGLLLRTAIRCIGDGSLSRLLPSNGRALAFLLTGSLRRGPVGRRAMRPTLCLMMRTGMTAARVSPGLCPFTVLSRTTSWLEGVLFLRRRRGRCWIPTTRVRMTESVEPIGRLRISMGSEETPCCQRTERSEMSFPPSGSIYCSLA